MNINFHYAAIKVLAEHAGFPPKDSEVIAYASQYVDDATAHQRINLDKNPNVPGIRYNGREFDPICTAHRDLGYAASVVSPRARRVVYACFHFVPSFEGGAHSVRGRRVAEGGAFARKLVEEAVRKLRASSSTEPRVRRLIRLGVALHSYADTWAHQGFSGFWKSADNDISDLKIKTGSGWQPVGLASTVLSYAAPDIGHAEAGTLPDRSDVAWDCKPPKMTPKRDNCREFLDAAEAILTQLGRATRKEAPLASIKERFERCLRSPARDAEALRSGGHAWATEFPQTTFGYDGRAWFRAALEPSGRVLDFLGYALGLDQLDYTVLRDKKYFHFHAVAKEQRDTVERQMVSKRIP